MADSFYSTRAWRDLREQRLAADRGVCLIARLLGEECEGLIHVHHIKSLESHPALALDFENTASVCARHHPTWEAIRRRAERELPPCRHVHRYRFGREACERERRRKLLALPQPS